MLPLLPEGKGEGILQVMFYYYIFGFMLSISQLFILHIAFTKEDMLQVAFHMMISAVRSNAAVYIKASTQLGLPFEVVFTFCFLFCFFKNGFNYHQCSITAREQWMRVSAHFSEDQGHVAN